ncbi:MAG: hypothetical protein Q9184_004617, partial [Pyrenodesmia sp. 2 TL-2023]
MAAECINVAVIGYGLSAKIFHIPFLLALSSSFNLYAIVQRNPQPNNDASKDYPSTRTYKSTEEMLMNPSVHLVIITSTPATHYSLCRLCLEHQKHVVVEKPFTPTQEEAGKLIELARQRRLVLTVYQNRRWDADFMFLSRLHADGVLGRIAEFETHFDRHRPELPAENWKTRPEPGTGAIYDLGVHLIDQIFVLCGLPDRVTGVLGTQRQGGSKEIDDSFTVLLHYDATSLLATVKAAVVSPETQQLRFWVRGEKGSYEKYNLDCQEPQLKAGMRPNEPSFGEAEEEEAYAVTTAEDGRLVHIEGAMKERWKPGSYISFYETLARCLTHGEAPPVDAEGARQVVRLIQLAKLSSDRGMTLSIKEKHKSVD